ncbi:MAG: CCA tRNA nucleotidyltransferase [Sneathiella sp.]|nr:MAG: CCA tRNA nucleotidyltransferase [Sneathiella sp.]
MGSLSDLVDIAAVPPLWKTWPETDRVVTTLENAGGTARFVGGCVRDALLGLDTVDVDICTDLTPEKVMAALEKASIKAIPTGIDHGTVTAVLGKHHFEITTLRVDVKSHGRHADVAFTQDWEQDATRRDFTINAIYMDREGQLFDPIGGIKDLKSGSVRFIGKAEDRIREDYLRVLRYFRFFARFSNRNPDPVALAACRAASGNLGNLSAERIRKEFLSLLSTDAPGLSIELMADTGILKALIGPDLDLALFQALISLSVPSDEMQRLASLLGGARGKIEQVVDRLRLSGRQKKRLISMAEQDISDGMSKQDRAAALYRLGPATFTDQTILLWARNSDNAEFAIYLEEARGWSSPTFPVTGTDLLARGREAGPEMGRQLAALEDIWVTSGFTATKAQLLDRLT